MSWYIAAIAGGVGVVGFLVGYILGYLSAWEKHFGAVWMRGDNSRRRRRETDDQRPRLPSHGDDIMEMKGPSDA